MERRVQPRTAELDRLRAVGREDVLHYERLGGRQLLDLRATLVHTVGSAIARWTGSSWAQESATVPGVLEDAAATGTSTIWGAGYRYDTDLAQIRTLATRTTNG